LVIVLKIKPYDLPEELTYLAPLILVGGVVIAYMGYKYPKRLAESMMISITSTITTIMMLKEGEK